MDKQSRREQLREWLKEEIDDQERVFLPDLADAAVEFFSEKPVFVRGLMDESLRPMVYEIAQGILGRGRGGAFVFSDGTAQSRESFEEEASQPHPVFDKWYEHTPQGHVKFKALTRPLAFAAAEERIERASGEYTKGIMLGKVAVVLPDDSQKVGALIADEELQEMWEESIKEAQGVARNLLPS